MWKVIILVVALICCSVTIQARQSVNSLTYNELAASLVAANYTAVVEALPDMNDTTLPQNIAAFRKDLLYTRNLLDIFVFAYPPPSQPNETDVWVALRQDMNVGYTVVGNFQDLNHSGVNYTLQELDERRNICLAWVATFTNNIQTYNYGQYVANPSPNQLYSRPDNEYSRFFWKRVGVQPSLSLSGLMNVAMLDTALLRQGTKEYLGVFNLPEVYSFKKHLQFHDYRKLTRTINYVTGSFNIIESNYTALANKILNITNTMYLLFGNLNDQVTAYQFYQQNGTPQQQAEQRIVCDDNWVTLRGWLQSNEYGDQLNLLSTLTIYNFNATTDAKPGPKGHGRLVAQ